MRLFTLARVAAEAEGLRLKLLVKRQAMRGVWGAVAAVFGIFATFMLHVTIFEFLAPVVGGGFAALIVLAIDLVALAIFGLMAAKSSPGAEEREAEAISRRARAQLTDTARTYTMFMPVAKVAGARGVRGALLTAAATRLLRRRRPVV